MNGTEQTKVPKRPERIVKRRLRKVEPKPKPYDKYGWILGHVITVLCTLVYSAYYFTYKSHQSRVAEISYRIGFVAVISSYFVSMVNQFGKIPPSYFTLLTTENFQYLLLAIVWLFNRSSFFKILPYFIISILQLSSLLNLKPVLKLEQTFKEIIIYNELFLFVLLLFDTLLFRGTSGYALVIFGLFYSLKIVFSDDTKGLIYSVIVKFDGVMLKQKNPKVQSLWHDIKSFLLKKKLELNDYKFQIKK